MEVKKRGVEPWSIRAATVADYDEITALWEAAGLSIRPQGRESRVNFERQVVALPGLYLVATEDDRLIGVVLGSHDLRKGWINRLAVLPACRRRGVAAGLVTACENALRADGMEIIAALVEPDNEASGALFESLGYRADVPVRYYRKLSRPQA